MSANLFILLQGGLAFGAPMALAVIELWRLRRTRPTPQGGGEPVALATRRLQTRLDPSRLPSPANSTAPRRAA